MSNQFDTPSKPERATELTEKELEYFDSLLNKYKKMGPNPQNFSDLYSPEEIEADERELERLKQRFTENDRPEDKRNQKYGNVLELLMMVFASSWLPHARFSKVSEYDDIKRQTDLLVELKGNDHIHRAAIDVTSSVPKSQKKLETIIDQIRHGQAGQKLKYAKSQFDNTRGELPVPRFVLGADREMISRLAHLYLDFKRAPTEEAKRAIADQIKNHPVKEHLQTQLSDQVNYFVKIFESLSHLSAQDAQIFQELKDLQTFLTANKKIPDRAGSPIGNKVTAAIQGSLQ